MNTSPNKLVLELELATCPPSFKNKKRVTRRGGLITDPAVKEKMELIQSAIASALCSAYQTIGGATSTGCSLQSWIRSSVPEDDCWQVVPEIMVSAMKSEKPTLRIEIEEIT